MNEQQISSWKIFMSIDLLTSNIYIVTYNSHFRKLPNLPVLTPALSLPHKYYKIQEDIKTTSLMK